MHTTSMNTLRPTTLMNRLLLCAFAALLLWLPAGRALAQAQNTGTVAGNVLDQQGAAVVGAIVKLTSVETAQVSTVKSNAKGEYLFTDVKVGRYDLTITAPTFEGFDVPGIAVDADQNVRQDGKLVNGSSSDIVTVQAESTVVDTRSATIGTVIDKNLVESLPIDGENIVSVAALLPGVSAVNAPTTFTSDTGGPTYSVSGSRSNQNLFLFDGIVWNNAFYNTGLNYPPRLALEEVSVLLNNFKAQYGRNSGSVFNVLTKSGSNSLHGTLWEYYQSSAFDAKDYISHLLPHLVQNQFGAAIGGPIKRDKAFFFLAYQDLRLAGHAIANDPTQTYAEAGLISPGVPLPCSATGQFAGYNCANFSQDFHFVGDPACGSPAVTCVTPSTAVRNPTYASGTNPGVSAQQIQTAWTVAGHTGISPCLALLPATSVHYINTPELPTVCFNPVAVAFLNKYIPFATQSNGGTLPVAFTVAAQPRNDQQGLARFDLVLPHHTIDARTFITNANDFTSNSVNTQTDLGIANYEQTFNSATIYFGSIGDTWVVHPNTLNVFRAGYKRYNYNILTSDPTTLKSLGADFTQPGQASLPQLEATTRFTAGGQNSGYSYTLTSNYEFDDNVSYTKGNHNIQAGVQFLDVQYVHRFDQVPFIQTEQQQTGDPIGDFLLGLTYNETVGNFTNLAALQHDLYLYAQDDWRATPRLTLNFGMRYEIPFSWREKDGQGTTFIPGYQSIVFPGSPSGVAFQGDPGVHTTPNTRYDNLGPRLGVVYDAFGNGKTSIRGGFGIFYNALNANIVGVGEPYHYSATYSAPVGGLSQPLQGFPAIPATYNKANPQFVTPFNVNYADPHLVTPYVMAFNFGFQQRIARSATLEMNYVGKLSRHDMILYDQNPAIVDCSGGFFQSNPSVYCPEAIQSSYTQTYSTTPWTGNSYQQRVKYPGFSYGGQGIVDNATIGSSSYNGLQVIYTQRSTKSVTTFASYTYSRALDVGSEGTTNIAHVPNPSTNLRSQYGPSDFNSTHIFNLGWSVKFPTTRRGSFLVRSLVNDWTFGGIYNARTGSPINVTVAGDVSFTDDRPQRAQLVPGVSPYLPSNRHRSEKVAQWFNTAAFRNPLYGTFGNVTRNSLVGPAYINCNADLQKRVALPGEGRSLELRLDGFNVFNTPNLANPGASLASATSANNNFGQITATVGTNGSVGSNGRRIQLGGIVRF